VDAEEFLDFVDKNFDKIFKKAGEMEGGKQKLDTKTKIFVYGSIVLGVIVTIMTFIWGLLR
jgi:hypothetical protein